MKYHLSFIIFLLLLISNFFLYPASTSAATFKTTFPKRANFFLSLEMTKHDVAELARWDVVILNMNQQLLHPEYIRELRQRNPNIIILAHVSSQEISNGVGSGAEATIPLRYKLWHGIQPAWYLRSPEGTILSSWPETHLLNVTPDCPRVNGNTWQTYLARFVASEMLTTDLWDGIFYDNTWDNITAFAGPWIDLNGDRLPDTELDQKWRAGMTSLFQETRAHVGREIVLVGNNDTQAYGQELNGLLIENFSSTRWQHQMERYEFNEATRRAPRLNMLNANTGNHGGGASYQKMRFGLASALLEDGYYSFDFGDQGHHDLWWYDEYNVNLGRPVGNAMSLSGTARYLPSVWQREFDRGVSLVNSTTSSQPVTLPHTYEKIIGIQDPIVNDGAIVEEVLMPPHDGLILLKILETLVDVVYRNGSFARFLRNDGTRVRNGLFLFKEERKGGDVIAEIDMDGNDLRDLLIASGPRLILTRDDGARYSEIFPYTANYTGELRVAIGDIDGDGADDLAVAPSAGPYPIKIYSRHGEIIRDDWFPYGREYRGGMSLAIGNLDSTTEKEIVIGSGTGRRPTVGIYRANGTKLWEWTAFEGQFRGGVSVAVGDVAGDSAAEIVVGAGAGKKPVVRIFDSRGKQLLGDIMAYTAAGLPGIEVQVGDVNFDGESDIIAFSRGLGL